MLVTFSLYSSLMMEQFRMEGGSLLGMGITLVTDSSDSDFATSSIFSLRISFVWTLLRPWAKKLLFSYSINLGFTPRLERFVISTVTVTGSPVTRTKERFQKQDSHLVTILCNSTVYLDSVNNGGGINAWNTMTWPVVKVIQKGAELSPRTWQRQNIWKPSVETLHAFLWNTFHTDREQFHSVHWQLNEHSFNVKLQSTNHCLHTRYATV